MLRWATYARVRARTRARREDIRERSRKPLSVHVCHWAEVASCTGEAVTAGLIITARYLNKLVLSRTHRPLMAGPPLPDCGDRAPDSDSDYDNVAPNASAMIESMRAYGYTLPTAVADLVDNSIAAKCTTVWVDFHWAGTDSWVAIRDDGKGMTEAVLRDAMRLGSRNPRLERDPSDLGRFGLGLKTASLSQCRRLTVASWTRPGDPVTRRWDLDYLSREGVEEWRLLKQAAVGSERLLTLPAGVEHGTVVLWEDRKSVV
jgi:hypothetical protein